MYIQYSRGFKCCFLRHYRQPKKKNIVFHALVSLAILPSLAFHNILFQTSGKKTLVYTFKCTVLYLFVSVDFHLKAVFFSCTSAALTCQTLQFFPYCIHNVNIMYGIYVYSEGFYRGVCSYKDTHSPLFTLICQK